MENDYRKSNLLKTHIRFLYQSIPQPISVISFQLPISDTKHLDVTCSNIKTEGSSHSFVLDDRSMLMPKAITFSTLQGSKSSEDDSSASKPKNKNLSMGERIDSSLVFSQNQEGKPLKSSLIDELSCFENDEIKRSFLEDRTKRLNLFESIEQKSLHDEDSYDFNDKASEIVELTQEQKDYFGNFIFPNSEELQQSNMSQVIVGSKAVSRSDLPDNKRSVIRNFFKPKRNEQLIKKARWHSELYCESRFKEQRRRSLKRQQGEFMINQL